MSSAASGVVTPPPDSILIYDDIKGLYGGAVIKGGAVSPDSDANHLYYGDYFTVKDILFDHKVTADETATDWPQRIDWHSQIHDDSKTASR